MSSGRLKYYLLLHFTVFIFGFTGILGKQITQDQAAMDSWNIVVYRMLIAFIGLFVYMKLARIKFKASRGAVLKFVAVGLLIAAHWITFFASINVSNVSVALACLSSVAMFTSIIEPIVLKKPFYPSELIMGIATILGIGIIVEAETQYHLGIMLSVIAAFLGALFGVLNAKFAQKDDPVEISTVEMISGCFFAAAFMLIADYSFVGPMDISSDNWWRLIILGLVATSFAFVVTIQIMRVLKPFTVALTINLEPVYAIIMALVLFPESETMSANFYLGSGIIIGTLILNAILKRRQRMKAEKA